MSREAGGQDQSGYTWLGGCYLDGYWPRERLAKDRKSPVRDTLNNKLCQIIDAKHLAKPRGDDCVRNLCKHSNIVASKLPGKGVGCTAHALGDSGCPSRFCGRARSQ